MLHTSEETRTDRITKLRPHHLLCTQCFIGKGYNEEFTQHMTEIVNGLRESDTVEVEIVFRDDDICSKCPKLLTATMHGKVCEDEDKVHRLDRGVIDNFGIQEKCYNYRDVIAEIKQQITAELFDSICGDCIWTAQAPCREILVDE